MIERRLTEETCEGEQLVDAYQPVVIRETMVASLPPAQNIQNIVRRSEEFGFGVRGGADPVTPEAEARWYMWDLHLEEFSDASG